MLPVRSALNKHLFPSIGVRLSRALSKNSQRLEWRRSRNSYRPNSMKLEFACALSMLQSQVDAPPVRDSGADDLKACI